MGVEGGECLWGLVGRWWSENWLPLWITATALEALLWRCGALWGLDGVFCEGALRWVLQEGGKWIYSLPAACCLTSAGDRNDLVTKQEVVSGHAEIDRLWGRGRRKVKRRKDRKNLH
jgi:hypothetical protein